MDAAAQRLDIGDEESTLGVVIQMETLSVSERQCCIYGPAFTRFHLYFHSRHEDLRDRKLIALDTPGAYVRHQAGHSRLVAKFVPQANPGSRGKELVRRGMEQQVPHRVSGDERVMTPRPPHLEFNQRSQVARTQVLLSEWSGLMDGGPANCEPLK